MKTILIPEKGDRILVKGHEGVVSWVPEDSEFIGDDPFCYAVINLDEFEGDDATESKVVWFKHYDDLAVWDANANLWRMP